MITIATTTAVQSSGPILGWFAGIAAFLVACFTAIFAKFYNPPEPEEPVTLVPTPPVPEKPTLSPAIPDLLWDTPQHAWHAVRVFCDLAGLSLNEKNLICACIYQESQFYNYLPDGKPVIHQNFVGGNLSSTDWGICQINDYWHVKKYPDFPTADYIMSHPDEAVHFMLTAYKNGGLKQWVSYSSGAYEKWLATDSAMWALAS